MEKILTEALTFDDVLLVPQHSQVLAARGGTGLNICLSRRCEICILPRQNDGDCS